jgi:hypothetical protein
MDIEGDANNPKTPPRCDACGDHLKLLSHISFLDYGGTPKKPDVMYFRCETCEQVKIVQC